MSERTDEEAAAIDDFLAQYFRNEYIYGEWDYGSRTELGEMEQSCIDDLINQVRTHVESSRGTLGLALDFLMVAEQLSQVDDWLCGFNRERDHQAALDRYEKRGKATLTFVVNGQRYGIRSVHNEVIDLFREDLRRTNFPSSPGHHTGEWDRYTDMLDLSLQLSRDGRYKAAQRIIDLGLDFFDRKSLPGRDQPLPDPLLAVLQEYDRKHPEEEAGTAYQAFAYGWVSVEWSHLSLVADKLRTGSSRQHRYGDIDGYYGPDLVVSVEVKDKQITDANVESELGTMINLAEDASVIAVAVCRSILPDAEKQLTEAGVVALTDAELQEQLQRWDYYKQNRALQGMIHYLENIEENPAATQRLLRFIQDIDPNNRSLDGLSEDNGGSSDIRDYD